MALAEQAKAAPSRDPDMLRTGLVRYLGYANEVGESFKPLVPRIFYLGSYGIAGSYVAADAAWRGSMPPAGRSALVEGGDTLVWQGLASVAVPGFVINRVVWAASQAPLPARWRGWAPTAAGLLAIPFIIRPIDLGVEHFMDVALRPLYEARRSSD